MERVVALQAAGLAAAGHDVTLVAAPGSAVPGVEVISPLDELPTQIEMATEEWRHVPDLQVTELGAGGGYLAVGHAQGPLDTIPQSDTQQ
jgi:hypothetical protein